MSAQAHVWARFTVKRDGKELKLRIQELPEKDFETMFEFLFKYFVPDETLHKASKISQNEEALEEYKQGFTMMHQTTGYQLAACCVDEESAELQVVGVSIMLLEKRGESGSDMETVKAMVQSEEVKTLLSLSTFMDNVCQIFEKFEVDACYKGRGLAVHVDYRALGIATELLRIRPLVCKHHGVPMTSAWMTSTATQKAAARLGWETVYELKYDDLAKMVGVEFKGAPASSKLMIVKI